MQRRIRRGVVVGAVVAVLVVPLAAGAVGGFASPLFGLATAPNGDILVADAGAGISAIRNGVVRPVVDLPGVTDIGPIGRGSM